MRKERLTGATSRHQPASMSKTKVVAKAFSSLVPAPAKPVFKMEFDHAPVSYSFWTLTASSIAPNYA